jgi:MYXO-CTERM domain-containing protein
LAFHRASAQAPNHSLKKDHRQKITGCKSYYPNQRPQKRGLNGERMRFSLFGLGLVFCVTAAAEDLVLQGGDGEGYGSFGVDEFGHIGGCGGHGMQFDPLGELTNNQANCRSVTTLFDQGGEWRQPMWNGGWMYHPLYNGSPGLDCVGYERPTDVLAGDEHVLSDERVGEHHRRTNFVVPGKPDLAIELDQFVCGATLFQTYTATNNGSEDADMIWSRFVDADLEWEAGWRQNIAAGVDEDNQAVRVATSGNAVGLTIDASGDAVFEGWRAWHNGSGASDFARLMTQDGWGLDELNEPFRYTGGPWCSRTYEAGSEIADVGIGVQSILSLAPGESGSFATRSALDPGVLPDDSITILGIVAQPAVLPLTLLANTRVDFDVPVDGCGICEIKGVTSSDPRFSVVLVGALAVELAADSSGSFDVEVECTAPNGTPTTSLVTVETDSDGDGTGDSLDPCTDIDGDGYGIGDACAGLDCDENNADINAGAVDECYDGIDSDCQQDDDFDCDGDGFVPSDVPYEGELPNGDCDDTDPNFAPDVVDDCYDGVDQNCDGADDYDCDGDGSVSPDINYDGPLPQDDCNDGDADIFAGAEDLCYDGVDSDCGDLSIVTSDFDCDGDGHIPPGTDYAGPLPVDDCDDADDTIYAGAIDDCYDGIDADCGTVIQDEDDYDCDGDGHVPTGQDYAGSLPVDDCDDEDASAFPGAEEVPYDDIDQDCTDGDLCDVDGDGSLAAECDGDDCDDTSDAFGPDAIDIPYDGIDQNCDGADLCDVDEDGFDSTECDGDDCDDDAFGVNPGAEDVPDDGVDQDCSGDDETLSDLDNGTDGDFVAGSCDCSSSGSTAPVWMGSLLVGLLLLRRRR